MFLFFHLDCSICATDHLHQFNELDQYEDKVTYFYLFLAYLKTISVAQII
jgi:hypothetical protein